MIRIKVCGMTRAGDVRLACKLGAWAVGFVMAPSPRRVTIARARTLRGHVPRGVLAIGVFVDAPIAEIIRTAGLCRFDAVQLHGRERPEQCRGLAVPVFKALTPSRSVRDLRRYRVKGFLIEPGRSLRGRFEGTKPSPAGLRKACLFARRAKGRRVILAGGLTPGNVSAAVRAARPYAVDVSSGVESKKGIKDPVKLRAFFEALR